MERNSYINNNNNNMSSNTINNVTNIKNSNNSNNTKIAPKSHGIKEMPTKTNHNKININSSHKSKCTPNARTTTTTQQSQQSSQQSSQHLTLNNNNNINSINGRNEMGFDRTPVGSASCSPQFIESYDTPPYIRWSQDFHYLIEDRNGVELFKKFLDSEGFGDLLDFWFACEGLKKSDNKEEMKKLIKLIFRKFIMNSQAIQLSDKVKTSLMHTKCSEDSVKKYDPNVFDAAQSEVETQMKSCIYHNFLRSDIYANYLNMQSLDLHNLGASGGYDSPKDGQQLATNSSAIESTLDIYNTRSQYYDVLPTVHEDSELQTSYQSSITNNNDNNDNDSNIRSHSQQRSQSFPSDESHVLMPSKSSQINIKYLNKILAPKLPPNCSPRLTTESHPLSTNKNTLYPAYQSYFRSKAMANPPNPYHVKYATVLPTSAQDSELQSISSHSTNESMSCVGGNDSGDSGFNSGLYPLPHTKKQMQHMNLSIKQNAKMNSANNINSGPNNDMIHLGLHPRPFRAGPPPSASVALNPDKFASILIEKLDKIRIQQEVENKNINKLREVIQAIDDNNGNNNTSKSVNTNISNNSRHSTSLATNLTDNRPKQTLKDVFIREKFEFASEESDQSIIDKHFAQVFNETPSETPTDPQQIVGCVSPPKHNHRLYSYDVSKTTVGNANNNSMLDSSLIVVTVKYSTEQVPYKLNITGPQITFRKFKQHIPAKRGNWQYYFKRKCNDNETKDFSSSAFIFEKITEDNDYLPQIDGKIFAIIESN